ECAVEFREDVQEGILATSDGPGRQITMSFDGADVVGIHIFLHKERGNVVDWQMVHKSGRVGPRATRSPNAGQKETLWFLDHFHGLQFAELDQKGIVDVGILDPPWFCEACWNQLQLRQYRSQQYLLPWPNYKFVRAQLEVGIPLRSTLLSSLEGQIVVHPKTEAWPDRARMAVVEHGICILPSVLASETIEIWKKGCQRLHQQVEEFGFSENRGHGRFSFGTAFKKGNCLHEPEWAQQIAGVPAVLQVLDAVWGQRSAYRCCGGGGECVAPQCWDYQRLHSDVGDLDANPLPRFLSVNFTVCDITAFNGPTRHVPGTMHKDPRKVPCVGLETPRFLLSTVAPLQAGAAIIRDVRAWHGGTPNVTEVPRYLPSIEYEPLSEPLQERSLPRSVYCSLPPEAQELCRDIVAFEGEQIDCSFRAYPADMRS
ncbi:unnamed protein product, partial [Symbiodinium sp. CCMP2456]